MNAFHYDNVAGVNRYRFVVFSVAVIIRPNFLAFAIFKPIYTLSCFC